MSGQRTLQKRKKNGKDTDYLQVKRMADGTREWCGLLLLFTQPNIRYAVTRRFAWAICLFATENRTRTDGGYIVIIIIYPSPYYINNIYGGYGNYNFNTKTRRGKSALVVAQ